MYKLLLILFLGFFAYAQDSIKKESLQPAQKEEFFNDFESEYSQQTLVQDPLIRDNRLMHNVNWGIYYVISPILDA